MQGFLEHFEHVIGCGHLSGLCWEGFVRLQTA